MSDLLLENQELQKSNQQLKESNEKLVQLYENSKKLLKNLVSANDTFQSAERTVSNRNRGFGDEDLKFYYEDELVAKLSEMLPQLENLSLNPCQGDGVDCTHWYVKIGEDKNGRICHLCCKSYCNECLIDGGKTPCHEMCYQRTKEKNVALANKMKTMMTKMESNQFNEMDLDRDGIVSLEEFRMWRKKTESVSSE